MAQRAFTSHPLVVRRVTVRRIEEITPRMRRIVVGGEGLGETVVDGHTHRAFAAPGFDDHIKLIFAADGDLDSALPIQLPHGIEWTAAENRLARDYTPRWVDAEAGEMALDFVLHGDGPAASWAQAAAIGDELCFVGPKSSLRLPEELDWIALIADETGLPAVGRFLDERPTDAAAHVLLLVEDDAARQELSLRPGDTVTWVTAPGGDAAALEEAVRNLALPADGEGYAWAAAESRALLPVRRYLQRERGLAKDRLNITGYWHAETVSMGDDASAPEIPPVVEPASPVPWLVVRAAVRLGVVDALADGPLPLSTLAARLGVAPRSLEALRGILTSAEVIAGDVDALSLGRFGEELLEEHHREEFDGLEAEAVLALRDLDHALREGVSPWQRAYGDSLAAQAQTDAAHVETLVEDAGRLAYLLDGFVANPMWDEVAHLLIVGPGAPAVLGAFEDGGRGGIDIALHESGLVRDAIVEDAGGSATVWDGRLVDVAVAALALAHRTDAEAVALLDELAPHTSRLILLESSRPDALSPDAEEHQVVGFAMTGAPFRSTERLGELAAAAGWTWERAEPLGWGIEATVLVRA
ncbi:SIP domain-containing protein [Microbacterium oxydans]|uniref:siderophore-interacting protein n=1 Tax=Microbacterium sp. B19(2022) TaxID=2914045 RepID=UPI00142FA194|nr:siderophore-interacting protein [Microbacterium sp. B19(2022)]NJI61529.1 SIP domain-containing protein [Microbacterium sp. B19(2022)]